ncbi:MAG: hypothetical protein GY702_24510 [Desulfobulbaceae bacterium]|nr:hypothetical protein [Desulfobulbaceae bacterium]
MTRRLSYQLASQRDDAEIRRLLRENPMGGKVSFSFEREPSYFDFLGFEGHFHQTIVAREEKENSLVGMASRGIRQYYVDGSPMDIGYLSQLRFTPSYRNLFSLKKGFKFLQQLHADGRVPFYLTSIMEGNSSAERILQSAIPGLPRYEEYCSFVTHVLSTRRSYSLKKGSTVKIELCRREQLPALLEFLQQTNCAKQFSPVWDEETLFSKERTPGVSFSDCILALEGGKIVGCMCLWDQRRFKQSVVRRYSSRISRFRPILNVAARLSGSPKLPAMNEPISHAYLSHVTIHQDREDIFKALLTRALQKARRQDISLLTVGFASNHPLQSYVEKSIKTIRSVSKIFLVYWEKEGTLPVVDRNNRIPGLEIALL